MRSLAARFARLARALGVAGARCPVCSALTPAGENPLCPTCAQALRPRLGGCCARCGDMFGDQTDDTVDPLAEPATVCAECRLDPPPWDRLHFHGPYSAALRDLIIDFKFHGGLHRTRLLVSLAAEAYRRGTAAVAPDMALPDLIVPVPLHPRRVRERGYNQSLELARGLGRALGRPVAANALGRVRHTAPQSSLDMAQRRENIRDAFVAAEMVRGKALLLVDDVYTTGATLTECARTLRRAGAAGMDALVLARAGREPR
ncbi:ComF family protein [Pseudodesulfovibrio sp. F-1]|uniref:ComF family protein n=1 Tax=Pseudodesulfovibrio alkaliphilus TaxID=2661613 RepID=A0A7K1KRP3_9BACT|nr:ComF family protein [Pseudodesulfovibrio alkaliphilus]MUM78773.1 ComF family protein [Pseudodesulfovibrio alkaliphilus]